MKFAMLCLTLALTPALTLAHAPPLEQLPKTTLTQVAPPATPELEQATVEATHTESTLLKLLGGLLTILTPLLGWLVKRLVEYLQAKKAEALAQGERATGLHALTVGAELVQTYVAKAEVEIKPLLVKALEDGVITKAEGEALKGKVMELIKRDMPVALMATLSGVLGPALEGWLSGKVEQAVTAQKATAAAGAASPS